MPYGILPQLGLSGLVAAGHFCTESDGHWPPHDGCSCRSEPTRTYGDGRLALGSVSRNARSSRPSKVSAASSSPTSASA